MDEITSERQWQQILNDAKGYVFNDFSGNGPSGSQYNVLHRADCSFLQSARLTVPKRFADSLDQARTWLDANRTGNWKYCDACINQTSTSSAARAIPPPGQATDIFREARVQTILVTHLKSQGYAVQESFRAPGGIIDVVAQSEAGRLVIEVKGEDRGGFGTAQMNFQMGIGQLLSRMADPHDTYCLAFPLTADFRRVLAAYRHTLGLLKAGISALAVGDDGSVLRLTPAGFQDFIDHDCVQRPAVSAVNPAAESNFVAPDHIEAALRRYGQLAKNRAWRVTSKARLYVLSASAFDLSSPRLADFVKIYEELRRFWQVLRGGTAWPPEKVFDVLLSDHCTPCGRDRLNLLRVGDSGTLDALWNCLTVMSKVKSLQGGGISPMAVSKFLHFFNPRLFPIYDRAVVRDKAFPHFSSKINESKKRWHDGVAAFVDEPLFKLGLGDYLHYLLWAADCFAAIDARATMQVFAQCFAAMLEAEGSDALMPPNIELNYANAFEFAMIGASPAGG